MSASASASAPTASEELSARVELYRTRLQRSEKVASTLLTTLLEISAMLTIDSDPAYTKPVLRQREALEESWQMVFNDAICLIDTWLRWKETLDQVPTQMELVETFGAYVQLAFHCQTWRKYRTNPSATPLPSPEHIDHFGRGIQLELIETAADLGVDHPDVHELLQDLQVVVAESYVHDLLWMTNKLHKNAYLLGAAVEDEILKDPLWEDLFKDTAWVAKRLAA